MFRRSSPRALISTRQTLCLPFSAASISAGTSGVSPLVGIEAGERWTRDRDPCIDLEVRPVEPCQLHGILEIEDARDRIDELVGDPQALLQALAHGPRHRVR